MSKRLFARMNAFLRRYDLLATPAASLPPFDVDIRWPNSVVVQNLHNYVVSLRLASLITLTACPAISVPAGFTGGKPVGPQLVGRPRGEAALLASAAVVEATLPDAPKTPILPRIGLKHSSLLARQKPRRIAPPRFARRADRCPTPIRSSTSLRSTSRKPIWPHSWSGTPGGIRPIFPKRTAPNPQKRRFSLTRALFISQSQRKLGRVDEFDQAKAGGEADD
jgi:hypothetical protein